MAKRRKLDEKAEKKIGLFDLLNDISSNKQYLFNNDTAQTYVPFMINKGLSQYLDTVLLAVEANKMVTLTKEMHHDFLFYSVDARKRYGKWAKKQQQDTVVSQWIRDTYHVGNERALEYLSMMTDDDIVKIEEAIKTREANKQ